MSFATQTTCRRSSPRHWVTAEPVKLQLRPRWLRLATPYLDLFDLIHLGGRLVRGIAQAAENTSAHAGRVTGICRDGSSVQLFSMQNKFAGASARAARAEAEAVLNDVRAALLTAAGTSARTSTRLEDLDFEFRRSRGRSTPTGSGRTGRLAPGNERCMLSVATTFPTAQALKVHRERASSSTEYRRVSAGAR